MTTPWVYGWESSSTDDVPPPKRSEDTDVAKRLERWAIRDRLAPEPRYRQTTGDEEWLNEIGISGMNPDGTTGKTPGPKP